VRGIPELGLSETDGSRETAGGARDSGRDGRGCARTATWLSVQCGSRGCGRWRGEDRDTRIERTQRMRRGQRATTGVPAPVYRPVSCAVPMRVWGTLSTPPRTGCEASASNGTCRGGVWRGTRGCAARGSRRRRGGEARERDDVVCSRIAKRRDRIHRTTHA